MAPPAGAVFLSAVLMLAADWSGRTQATGRTIFAPPRVDQPTGFGVSTALSDIPSDPVAAERRWVALNIERQKEITAESDLLLKLTRELNAEVAAGSGPFSADQIEKLNIIEKLARNVKDKMIDTAHQPPPGAETSNLPFVYSKPLSTRQ